MVVKTLDQISWLLEWQPSLHTKDLKYCLQSSGPIQRNLRFYITIRRNHRFGTSWSALKSVLLAKPRPCTRTSYLNSSGTCMPKPRFNFSIVGASFPRLRSFFPVASSVTFPDISIEYDFPDIRGSPLPTSKSKSL